MAWSTDGKTLASGSDRHSIRLWELESGTPIRQLSGHEGPVVSLAWSPVGNLLASGSTDETIRLWRGESPPQILEGHQGSVTSLAWSADGTVLCSASSDHSIRLWDVQRGKTLRIVGRHQDPVCSLAWSPTGYLASGGRDKVVRIWEPNSGVQVCSLEHKHTAIVWSVAWSHRGSLLASASADKTVRIWDAKRKQEKMILRDHRKGVRCLSFAADDRLLASKSQDGTVRIWRCDDWTAVAVLDEASDGNVGGLAFHPKKPLLATRNDRRRSIHIWPLDLEALGVRSEKPEPKTALVDTRTALPAIPPTRPNQDTAEKVDSVGKAAASKSTQDEEDLRIRWDVFLSYNSSDLEQVQAIGRALRDRGLKPFLDRWELRPGMPFLRYLEECVSSTRTAMIFIGAGGEGPFQKEEVDAFILRFVDLERPIIPVLLPGAPDKKKMKLPLLLENRTWIDLRERKFDEAMADMVWGITGVNPRPG